jgi:hypothetical protein
MAEREQAQDGERVVFMGQQGDCANGTCGHLRLMIEWEDGASEPFKDFIVDQHIEYTRTWIVSR